ncbi:MAG: CinA family nicotinamide mononucleotide deamidase-related protein [Phycisphaeraceae bacterium]|nr:CinA family nicotinamide mononucleotide deamidase-related protein [Phycisphaeraceae bacterium]
MKAAILSIGDELILGQIAERNAGWLSAQLAEIGVLTREHRTVADDLEAIVRALRELLDQARVVITTGGLGPTDDDLLRPALARVLGDEPLVEDPEARAALERWFANQHRVMPEINLRQAQRPVSASCLENPHGTAPGLVAPCGESRVWCLPGPPVEMHPMFERFIRPALEAGRRMRVVKLASIPCFGLGESVVAERLGELMARDRDPLVGTTASNLVVTIRIRSEQAMAHDAEAFDAFVDGVIERVHPYALGRSPMTIAEAFAEVALAKGVRAAFAESCTAGLASAMLGEVPGASRWLEGSVVSYSNEIKASMLGVPPEILNRHGAVSAESAAAMVRGAIEKFGVSAAASITGVAGPDGGSESKPVGTVFIATAVGRLPEVVVRRFRLPGLRKAIQERSARSAIGALRLHLLGWGSVPLLGEAEPARAVSP